MIATLVDVVSWALLLAGAGFCLVGGLGLMRLPDVYTRMHAAGITDTMGAGLIVLGLILQGGFTLVSVKLALIMLFIVFTSPTSTHALAQAALAGGLAPWRKADGSPRSGEDAKSNN
jgi:multicomponent Na+:H+ antiporter subunit G